MAFSYLGYLNFTNEILETMLLKERDVLVYIYIYLKPELYSEVTMASEET